MRQLKAWRRQMSYIFGTRKLPARAKEERFFSPGGNISMIYIRLKKYCLANSLGILISPLSCIFSLVYLARDFKLVIDHVFFIQINFFATALFRYDTSPWLCQERISIFNKIKFRDTSMSFPKSVTWQTLNLARFLRRNFLVSNITLLLYLFGSQSRARGCFGIHIIDKIRSR